MVDETTQTITNKKYTLLNESLKAIAKSKLNLLMLIGEAGMSKTFNTLNFLETNNTNYTYINAYSTPLSFYELLYKNSEKEVVVFDDVSSISNPLIISLLKSSCWESNNKKIVSYYSTSKILEQRELPESFEFNARVILIFNQEIREYSALINRGVKITFNFTFQEKLKIFEEIQQQANIEQDVLDYVKTYCNEATQNLSIRTLVILSNLHRAGFDFKQFASEMLNKNEDIEMLLTMNAKEWSEATGYHVRTYFKRRKRFGFGRG